MVASPLLAAAQPAGAGAGDVEEAICELRGIASLMFNETVSLVETYKASMDQQTYDYVEPLANYVDLNAGQLDQVEALRQKLAAMEGERAATALRCCELLGKTVAFYCDYYHSSDPLMEWQMQVAEGAYENQEDLLDGMYVAMGLVKNNYSTIELPAYATGYWPPFVAQVDAYREKLYADYMALVNGDPLMQASSQMLLARQPFILWHYEKLMYDTICAQYANCYNMFSEGAGQGLTLDYQSPSEIYPNLYPTLDSILNIAVYTDGGERQLVVEAEIEGFTQPFRQMVTVTPEVNYLMIKPAVKSEPASMATERQAQITLQISDAQTGQIYALDSIPVTLRSIYDFTMTDDKFGIVEPYNILAWLRPDAAEVLEVRRAAIDWLYTNCGEGYDSLVGYQLGYPDFNEGETTQLQCYAIQGAMSDMGIRYNMGPFSFGSFQRVLTPDKVVESRSGICIETSILTASILQSTNMHSMILILPGHAQVAVESWRGSGEYYLLETTKLPMAANKDEFGEYLTVLSQEEWADYLANRVNYVIDCNLAKELKIRGLATA